MRRITWCFKFTAFIIFFHIFQCLQVFGIIHQPKNFLQVMVFLMCITSDSKMVSLKIYIFVLIMVFTVSASATGTCPVNITAKSEFYLHQNTWIASTIYWTSNSKWSIVTNYFVLRKQPLAPSEDSICDNQINMSSIHI